MTEPKESAVSKIAIRVAAAVLTAGALWLLSTIPGLLQWLWGACVSFWMHLKGTSGLPNFGLYVLLLLSTITVINILRAFVHNKTKNKTTGVISNPTFMDYTSDRFFGLVWRWGYYNSSIDNVWAFCPICDTVLVYSQNRIIKQIFLHCETCRRDMYEDRGDKDYLVAKVSRQIDRTIRSGEWKTKINTQPAN